MSGSNPRHLDLGQTGCTRVDNAHRRIIVWLALHRTGQADAERLHRVLQRPDGDELLNESLFIYVDQVRQLIGAWVTDYNTARPHSSLGYKTPAAYADALTAPNGVTLVEALRPLDEILVAGHGRRWLRSRITIRNGTGSLSA
jgi:hypothetical protein